MKEALKLALEALERSVAFYQYAHQQVMSQPDHFMNQAITAIKESLAEPDNTSKMYEELRSIIDGGSESFTHDDAVQYLKDKLAQPEQETQAYREAAQLAKWLFKTHYAQEEHYASGRVVWGLCDTTAGVISQIDNMVCKLVLPKELEQEPVVHSVITGALFDFMGWLTSRKERLVLSSADEASPAVDAIRDFAKMRGMSLDDAKVQDWNTTPPQPKELEQEPVAWLHTKIEGVAVPHRPADLDKHPDRWEALYKAPPPCPTCEALARTVMLDQTYHDNISPQRTWVGLTESDRRLISYQWQDGNGTATEIIDLVEAKLVAAKATDEANARSNTSWTLMCKKMVEDEREACAKVCDDLNAVYNKPEDAAERVASQWCAERIRARS
jgi:hypothetical protein